MDWVIFGDRGVLVSIPYRQKCFFGYLQTHLNWTNRSFFIYWVLNYADRSSATITASGVLRRLSTRFRNALMGFFGTLARSDTDVGPEGLVSSFCCYSFWKCSVMRTDYSPWSLMLYQLYTVVRLELVFWQPSNPDSSNGLQDNHKLTHMIHDSSEHCPTTAVFSLPWELCWRACHHELFKISGNLKIKSDNLYQKQANNSWLGLWAGK